MHVLLHVRIELVVELAGWRDLKVELIGLHVGVAVHGIHGVQLSVVLTLFSTNLVVGTHEVRVLLGSILFVKFFRRKDSIRSIELVSLFLLGPGDLGFLALRVSLYNDLVLVLVLTGPVFRVNVQFINLAHLLNLDLLRRFEFSLVHTFFELLAIGCFKHFILEGEGLSHVHISDIWVLRYLLMLLISLEVSLFIFGLSSLFLLLLTVLLVRFDPNTVEEVRVHHGVHCCQVSKLRWWSMEEVLHGCVELRSMEHVHL